MPIHPTDTSHPLIAFVNLGTAKEPDGPLRGLRTDQQLHAPPQLAWPEPDQLRRGRDRTPLRGEGAERETPRQPGVGQDKIARLRDRTGSAEPASNQNGLRSQLSTRRERAQSRTVKRRTVPIIGWASPAFKAEIKRIADLNDLSVSATMVSLLERAVQQDLHAQHAALLQPLIQQAVRHEMRALGNRLASLLISILYIVSQIRQLLINVLVRLPSDRQMSEDVLNAIRDGSAKRASQEVRHQTPQVTTLIQEELRKWQ